jgi:hypothetical protein
MRYLIIILASWMLVGCAKQSSLALYAFNEKPNNKAFVITSSDGWGFSTAQVSTELAIMGAFYECEKKNLLASCELEKVNGKYIFSKEEKDKWKNQYKNEKNSYAFLNGDVSHKDPSKNQLAKQKEAERKAKLLNNKDWKIITARDNFKGVNFSYISSNSIRPEIPLRFPYNDLTVKMILYCNDYSDEVHLQFSGDPNLVGGKFLSYGDRFYRIDAKVDNVFTAIYGTIKNDNRYELVLSPISGSDIKIKEAKDLVLQVKHFVGTTNYNFNLSNIPESCD